MINWPENTQAKKNAFVLLATDHGSMIVNRFDYNTLPNGGLIGVGYHLFETSSFDPTEMNLMIDFLIQLKKTRGPNIVMLDGGANIGAHSLVAGRLMQGWGSVISFEAQERVFYALAGNIALNNLFNVQVNWKALSQISGEIDIPFPDYLKPSSFGSLEMQQKATSENIGQKITKSQKVQAITIDSLNLNRLDFLKLDIEGMEEQALFGATHTINKFKPIILLEHFKSDVNKLNKILDSFGYNHKTLDHANTLAIHKDDPIKM